MRKLIVFLAVAALAASSAVAQDASGEAPTLKASGYVGAGFIYNYDGTDGSISLYDYNNGTAGVRASVDVVLDGGFYGVKAGVSSDSVTDGFPGNLAINDTLGWVYLGDKLVKLSLGKVDNGTYATYVNGNRSWDGSVGVTVDIAPVAGLSIGYYLPVALTPDLLETQLEKSQIAASFELDKVFGVKAGFDFAGLDEELGGNFWASASLLAVENLTLQVDAELTSLASETGTQLIDQYIAYSFAPVTVDLYLEQNLTSGTGLTDFVINPGVSVALEGITPAVGFALHTNSDNGINDNTPTWNLNPNVTIPVADNSFLVGVNVGSNGAGGAAYGDVGFEFYTTYVLNF